VFYILPDHLGTPRAVTNEQNTVVWKNDPLSDPFGNAAPEEDPDGDGQKFTLNLRFPGQYFDGETQTHYNYFRDYDPATGRYVQSDPIGLKGGVNTYSYVEGNPLSFSDPLGLQAVPMPPPSIPGFPSSGGAQGKGNDGSMGGLFPPGTFPGNTSSNGGPMSTPGPAEAAAGNQVDTAIQQAYNNYASNARMNCPGNDPDDRCTWLSKNAQYFPAAAVKATAKAWGCRGSRWSGGNKY
jgi:RHS repeat-associated protein